MHEGLTTKQLISYVEEAFSVKVSVKWVKSFLQRYKDELSVCQTKLLANKRVNTTILEHVVKFILQI